MAETPEQVRARRPGAATTAAPKPLGVPSDFVAMRNVEMDNADQFGPGTLTVQRDVVPTFFDGDEMRPASLPPAQVARLQDLMASAGLLSEYRRGYWDPSSTAAYTELLSFANASGIEDPQEALRQIAQSPPVEEEQQRRAPLVSRLSNPIEVADIANEVARKRAGRRFSDDELSRFQAAYAQAETGAQAAAYAAAESGGAVVEAPPVDVLARAEAERVDPHGAREMDLLELNNTIMGFLASSAGDAR